MVRRSAVLCLATSEFRGARWLLPNTVRALGLAKDAEKFAAVQPVITVRVRRLLNGASQPASSENVGARDQKGNTLVASEGGLANFLWVTG